MNPLCAARSFALFVALLLAASLLAQPSPQDAQSAPQLQSKSESESESESESAPQSAPAASNAQSTLQSAVAAHRARVALALSGGGSLGLAHIGVIQYLEEHHIPIDAIAGTSMGGLVGGFYATGHTPAEMEAAFNTVVWDDMLKVLAPYQDLPVQARLDRAHNPGDYALHLGHGLSLPAGLSTAEPLNLFLSRQLLAYSAEEDFDQLPTRFRCVATQLENGEAYVFHRGNLARALRATMAVPGIFTPVEWQGHILVDGGLVDNLPTDVARQMGADIVIAVHFSTPMPPARQLHSLPNVLTQAVSVAVSVTERDNLRNADLVVEPSLVGISGIDFDHARELIERGYQAAQQQQGFLAKLALNDADWAAYLAERQSRMHPAPPPPARLVAHSSDRALARHAQAEFDRAGFNDGLNDGGGADAAAPLSLDHIEHELSTLTARAALPGAFYGLAKQPGTLAAELEPRTGSQFYIRPSLELAVANGEPTRGSLHAFATWLPQDAYGPSYRMQVAVGYSPRLAAEAVHPLGGSQWFWSPGLDLHRQDTESYSGDLHLTHWQDTYFANFDLGYGLGQRLRLRLGVAAGYEDLSAIQYRGVITPGDGASVVPRLLAEWNSLDDPLLPHRGNLFSASMAARYRSSDGRTTPLGRADFEQHISPHTPLGVPLHTPLQTGTATLRLEAASTFGAPISYFDLLPLGGPTDLRAFRYEQFHASSFALGEVAYRNSIGEFKLFGQRPQFGAWYDAAGVVQPLQSWQYAQSGSLGVLFTSPLGVVTLAVGRTNDGQTRAWINVGRP